MVLAGDGRVIKLSGQSRDPRALEFVTGKKLVLENLPSRQLRPRRLYRLAVIPCPISYLPLILQNSLQRTGHHPQRCPNRLIVPKLILNQRLKLA
jgi:hypothetical protein